MLGLTLLRFSLNNLHRPSNYPTYIGSIGVVFDKFLDIMQELWGSIWFMALKCNLCEICFEFTDF